MGRLFEIADWRFHTAVRSLVLLLLAAAGLSAAPSVHLQAPQSAAQDLSAQVGKTRTVCGVVSATRRVKKLTYLDLDGKDGDEAVSVALELNSSDDFVPKRALGLRICATGKIRKENNTPGFIVKLEDTRGSRSDAGVRKWTFYPTHKDGVPFAAVVTLEVMFRLH